MLSLSALRISCFPVLFGEKDVKIAISAITPARTTAVRAPKTKASFLLIFAISVFFRRAKRKPHFTAERT